MNTKYPTHSFVRQSSGGSESSEASVQIRLCSSYHTNWRTSRRTTSQDTPCPETCCGEVVGSKDIEEAFAPRPFVGMFVEDVFVVFAGGVGDWAIGVAWRLGNGGRVARSSGA